MNLTVAINANLDPKTAGGVQSNLLSLVTHLIETGSDPHCLFSLFSDKSLIPTWRKIVGERMGLAPWPFPLNWFVPEAEKKERLSPRALEWYSLPPEQRRRRNDRKLARMGTSLVHFPHQVFFETSLPSIYEPWDLQHEHLPEFFSQEELAWRREYYRRGCAQAALIVTATDWTKKDLVAQYGIEPSRIAVIRRDSGNVRDKLDKFERARVLAEFQLPNGFAFYPGMNFPHKNHIRALQTIARLRDAHGISLFLVCSGRILTEAWPPIEHAIREFKLEEQVRFLGPVTEEKLCALYGSARVLFFPSLFEGLGFPVLEAFYHGLPVLAAASACLPEVVGEAGLLFDPLDVDAMTRMLKAFLESPRLEADLRESGRHRLADFEWTSAAPNFIACYKFAANQPMTSEEESRVAAALDSNI